MKCLYLFLVVAALHVKAQIDDFDGNNWVGVLHDSYDDNWDLEELKELGINDEDQQDLPDDKKSVLDLNENNEETNVQSDNNPEEGEQNVDSNKQIDESMKLDKPLDSFDYGNDYQYEDNRIDSSETILRQDDWIKLLKDENEMKEENENDSLNADNHDEDDMGSILKENDEKNVDLSSDDSYEKSKSSSDEILKENDEDINDDTLAFLQTLIELDNKDNVNLENNNQNDASQSDRDQDQENNNFKDIIEENQKNLNDIDKSLGEIEGIFNSDEGDDVKYIEEENSDEFAEEDNQPNENIQDKKDSFEVIFENNGEDKVNESDNADTLDNDDNINEDSNDSNYFNDLNVDKVSDIDQSLEIVKEAKRILDEIDSALDEKSNEKLVDENLPEESSDVNKEEEKQLDEETVEDEETVNKVYEDLNLDLENLFNTWDKLSSNEGKTLNYVEEYEENNNKPFREENVLSQRYEENDYEEFPDNLDEINLAENENDNANKTETVSDESNKNLEKEGISEKKPDEEVANEASKEDNKTEDVDNLSSSELNQLIEQFKIAYSAELDAHAEGFNKNVAPVTITLSTNETTVITSPNYPSNYPTNNIVDWMLVSDGTGMGIELNITDFAVNGAIGDYLLIKPGGTDETGQEGLIFTYRLNSERRYRFMDVDRMFVRFEARTGLAFNRGFQFSVKMIPKPESSDILEELPDPEASIGVPQFTYTVALGGVPLVNFETVKDDLRNIIADMATMYINANDIDPGRNTTSEVTQIVDTLLCNLNWPDFHNCVQVRFGVPLQYAEEEDARLNREELRDMWHTYVDQDPFETRLRTLGLSEFPAPNEEGILTVWLVIGFGVIISMSMLAFALWRYSCVDNYTRMPTFSDTDSILNEKRGLDLYPTPHQTLPPLYADIKWTDDTTRVDMGGFTNKNYTPNEFYHMDSDEEVVNGSKTAN